MDHPLLESKQTVQVLRCIVSRKHRYSSVDGTLLTPRGACWPATCWHHLESGRNAVAWAISGLLRDACF